MQRSTLVAFGCALAFMAGGAFAQQQGAGSTANTDTSTETLGEKARHAAQTIGEKAKDAMGKVKEMAKDTADASDNRSSSKIQQMQKQADADFKSAKAKCDSIDSQSQKNVCEKQASVTHANAELRIAKAHAAEQGSKTSAMGAGKATQK